MAAKSCFSSYIRRGEGIRPTVRLWPIVPEVTVITLPSKDRMRALIRGMACAAASWANSPHASAASKIAFIRIELFTPKDSTGKFHRAKTAKLGWYFNRHPRLDLRRMDRERAFHD